MSYKLEKPYTEKQKADFIVEYNHNQGLNTKETPYELFALEANEMLEEYESEEEREIVLESAVYEEVDVLDFQQVLILDENGDPILDENGEFQYKEEKILVPEYSYEVYETNEEGMPIFDEEGKPILKEIVTVPEHYKTHKETVIVKEAVMGTETVKVTRYRAVINPNYEAEKAAQEAQRIAMLNLTAADVERGLYKALKIDFEDIIEQITLAQPQGVDIKALKIELKANNFYRGNPYIDAVGGLLGLTKEQLDKFFETNDYTYLLPTESEVVSD